MTDDILTGSETDFNTAQTESTILVDIEPLKTELVGVNEKLSVILSVILLCVVWKLITLVYKFFDIFFSV